MRAIGRDARHAVRAEALRVGCDQVSRGGLRLAFGCAARAQSGGGECSQVRNGDHWGLMPAALTTFPHFTMSVAMIVANSSGVLDSGSAPSRASISRTDESL